MCDTLSYIKHYSRRSSRSVKTQHSGRGEKESWRPKRFKKDLGYLVSVLTGIQGSLRQKDWMVFGFDIDVGFRIEMLWKEKRRDCG
jgi:hypothetical protein